MADAYLWVICIGNGIGVWRSRGLDGDGSGLAHAWRIFPLAFFDGSVEKDREYIANYYNKKIYNRDNFFTLQGTMFSGEFFHTRLAVKNDGGNRHER